MKNTTLCQLGALLVLTSAAGKAIAGYRETESAVTLFESNGSGIASGSLAGVRANGNPADDIGCWLENDAAGQTTGSCQVVKGNVTRTCHFTGDLPAYYYNLSTMTAQSKIIFAWNPSLECNFLQVIDDSAVGPKSVQ